MTRMRVGEWTAAAGGVGLFVLLFFDWFDLETPPSHGAAIHEFSSGGTAASGWSSLGWFMVVLLCVQMFGAAALAYMTLKRTSPAWPVGASVLSWTLGALIWLVLLVRVTIAQPGPDVFMAVQLPAYLGLLFSVLIPVGGFLSLRDERTRSPEARAYMPPPARTAPGT